MPKNNYGGSFMFKVERDLNEIIEDLERLFKKNPERFEDLRKEIINQAINSYPEEYRQRARGIQFGLDFELNKHKNPAMRMNRMVELFWDKVYEFQAVVSDPVYYSEKKKTNKKEGKVISLYKC